MKMKVTWLFMMTLPVMMMKAKCVLDVVKSIETQKREKTG